MVGTRTNLYISSSSPVCVFHMRPMFMIAMFFGQLLSVMGMNCRGVS